MLIRSTLISCLLALLFGNVAALADTLTGHVLDVVDGNTLRIEIAGHGSIMIQLAWIEAPDRAQEHGEQSRQALKDSLVRRAARVETVTPMANGQSPIRATVWITPPDLPCAADNCPKTLDLAHAQLLLGNAWHDRRRLGQPQPSFGQYESAEFESKARRRGLWAAKNPVPPWDWRPR